MKTGSLLERLHGVKKAGAEYRAICPAHEDEKPSLSIREKSGKILIHCHAGCTTDAICSALGIRQSDLFIDSQPTKRRLVATYDYTDEDGSLLYQKLRYAPKDFRIRIPDGKGGWLYKMNGQAPVLYNLTAFKDASTLFVCEGEKDVETLRQYGYVGTTNFDGAGKWRPEYNRHFAGRVVFVLPDNDAPGRRHAAKVYQSLAGFAEYLRIVQLPNLPDGGDVSDWFNNGGTTEEFNRICLAAPEGIPAGWLDEPATTTGEKSRVLRRRCLADVTPKTIEYLIPEVLPMGKVVSLISQEGDGKSTLSGYLASVVSRGGHWPTGGTVPAGDVVIFSHEESPEHSIAPRLIANGAELGRIHLAESVIEADGQETEFDIERDIQTLDDWADELPDLRLVIFDPITSYVSCNENSNSEVRRALKPLIDFAERRNVCVLALSHLSKKVDLRMINRTLGSRAWSAVPRMVWALQVETAEDEDGHKIDTGSRFLLCVKCNLGRKPQGLRFAIEDSGAVVFDTERFSRNVDQDGGAEPSRASEIGRWLTDRIGVDVVPASEITKEGCKKWGISKQRLGKIASQSGIHKRFSVAEGCWVWTVNK